MPKRVIREQGMANGTYARFVAEPFESGYGHTVGNCLRRVLLSSLEGAAISSVKITGAQHEFCSIPGVVEDVTDIILNLKKVLFKLYTRETQRLTIKVDGPGEVNAGHIAGSHLVEVLNPKHYLATLAADGKFEAELEISLGRGYLAADWSNKKDLEIGVIPIDCAFSPVRRVNFSVENIRVGRRTDYEKLILDVWTDERLSPDEAVTRAAVIMRHHLDTFVNFNDESVEFEQVEGAVDKEREELSHKLNMSVNEIELSVRAANCLNNANILTVGELAQKTEAEMLKYRNFGKKSLQEIVQKLKEMGISMGATFDPGLLKNPAEELRD
ncbi:MAG: DNA-directed RNA polymerase subunit alpha [Lentisphaerae bacterium]|nr:DNA-directed RNA polymerase subunit alpha [Lentisphaerota bacterium]